MGVYLITGDDESLALSAVAELLARLVGDGDRSMMVDDFDSADYEMRAVVDAAQTSPFLTDKRVVVARDIGRFNADEAAPLVALLGSLLDTTELVLVTGGKRLPKVVTDASKGAGVEIIATAAPTRAAERSGWFADQVAAVGLRLDAHALRDLASWLGEEPGRLAGVLETLLATYGAARVLKPADVAPFLGEAGGVPPWELTDAIGKGDTGTSLRLLRRMLRGGERHPLMVMSTLHSHYAKLLALDGADARDDAAAAVAIGIKPGFPAKKLLTQYRKMGGANVSRAIGLLAQADLDLRGAKDWPEELVMEVLVARLSRL